MFLRLRPEKTMASHSSTLAWKIPWMEEPGRLQSMGSLRVKHDWATSLSLFTFMHWRRKWQPTQVFLPGESQGRGSLVGLSMGLHRHDWNDLAAAATILRQIHTDQCLLNKSRMNEQTGQIIFSFPANFLIMFVSISVTHPYSRIKGL